ncbi:MAG: hypothetical protein JNM17_24875 [Archangium sp.]|nr:hypothetical protein [Archangium sp.]
MSDIRNLLARAQESENKGEKAEAAEWLRKAATWYRDRQQLRRAAQMLRQARRVEGLTDENDEAVAEVREPEPDEIFGFGDDFEADVKRVLIEKRAPELADPALDAWCSFCCKPKEEVGQLVAGPAGAFICAACTEISGALRGALPHPEPSPRGRGDPSIELIALAHELPSQRRARERFMRLRPKLALVIGPSGSGKTAWIHSIAHAELQVIDATRALTQPLDEKRNVVLVVTAEIPPPALVLKGEHGDEPIHDTASLSAALPHLPAQVTSRIDAVHGFEAPHETALLELARHLADKRGLSITDEALAQVVSLVTRTKSGAHELVAVLARIPPGRYSASS